VVDELHKEASAPESIKLRSGDPEVVQQEVCHQEQEAMELGNVTSQERALMSAVKTAQVVITRTAQAH
jgi:hypothetical protein